MGESHTDKTISPHTSATYIRDVQNLFSQYTCGMDYCIAEKNRGIKFREFALEQTISRYKFRNLHAGNMHLYCDIGKFVG